MVMHDVGDITTKGTYPALLVGVIGPSEMSISEALALESCSGGDPPLDPMSSSRIRG